MIAPTSTEPGSPGGPWRSAATFSVSRSQKFVMDRLLDVDPLDRDADLARVVEAVDGCRVGGSLEVGVGEHDHRVLAAELEAETGVSVCAACAITFLPVATEPVNITKSTSSTSAAPVSPRPVATWKTPSGQTALGQHLGHQQRGQRGDLRGLEDDGVARSERRDAVAERVVEREVPGPDHADDAERRVADRRACGRRRAARRTRSPRRRGSAGACLAQNSSAVRP